jgi:hypothetical protein
MVSTSMSKLAAVMPSTPAAVDASTRLATKDAASESA